MAEGLNKIEHLVILMMENRSFDHYFGSYSLTGSRPEVVGLTPTTPPLKDSAGTLVPFWNMGSRELYSGYADPPHGWDSQHGNWNNGLNDGFITEFQKVIKDKNDGKTGANIPVGYYTRETLSVLYALADEFSLCDHWFSSVLSSTWPNRKYLYSGHRDSDNDTGTLPKYPGFTTKLFVQAIAATTDESINQKLTWRSYFSDLPFLAFWYDIAAYHRGHFKPVDDFVHDCREGTLPTVSLIDPPFSLCDDHPSHNVLLGEKFIGLIVDALTNSQSWENTALVILYDENGAFHDHVPPPKSFEVQEGLAADLDDPLGFRVPALVISPYAKKGVCHTVFDHTSIIKSINTRWGVEFPTKDYGTRWPLAPDIWSHCFDFNLSPDARPMKTYTESPADIAAGKPNPIQSMNWGSGIHEALTGPVGGVAQYLERIFVLPQLKALDHRSQVFDHLNNMEQNVITLKRMANP